MNKIYLITFRDKDVFNGTVMVSHGVHEETLQNITMPQEPLSYYISVLKAQRDESGEYFFYDES